MIVLLQGSEERFSYVMQIVADLNKTAQCTELLELLDWTEVNGEFT